MFWGGLKGPKESLQLTHQSFQVFQQQQLDYWLWLMDIGLED